MFWNAFAAPRSIDRVFLDDVESVTLDAFVEGYLRSRNFSPTPANRDMVIDKLSSYRRRAPVRSEDLVAFLDKGWLN